MVVKRKIFVARVLGWGWGGSLLWECCGWRSGYGYVGWMDTGADARIYSMNELMYELFEAVMK